MANPVIVGHSTPKYAKNSGLGIHLPKKCLSLNNVKSKMGFGMFFFVAVVFLDLDGSSISC